MKMSVVPGSAPASSGTEFIALACRVERVKEFANCVADDVAADLGTIFSPIGFHHPGFRTLDNDDKASFLPKILDRSPQLIGRGADNQPALISRTLDAHLVDCRQDNRILRLGCRCF